MQPARKIRLLVLAPFLFLLALSAGCATQLRHDVTVFHDWPDSLTEKTFELVTNPAFKDSLRQATYQRIVRDELIAAGFVESPEPALAVSFNYLSNPRTIRYVDNGPVFSPYFSLGHRHGRGGFSISAPLFWGWSHYSPVHEVKRHERVLTVEIEDLRQSEAKRIYEATASSTGNRPAMVTALPLLVQSVLADFPGRSGVARQVILNLPPE